MTLDQAVEYALDGEPTDLRPDRCAAYPLAAGRRVHVRQIDRQMARLQALKSELRTILRSSRTGSNGRPASPHVVCPLIEMKGPVLADSPLEVE